MRNDPNFWGYTCIHCFTCQSPMHCKIPQQSSTEEFFKCRKFFGYTNSSDTSVTKLWSGNFDFFKRKQRRFSLGQHFLLKIISKQLLNLVCIFLDTTYLYHVIEICNCISGTMMFQILFVFGILDLMPFLGAPIIGVWNKI